MTRAYFCEEDKMAYSPYPKWSWAECDKIARIMNLEKDYPINCVSRIGSDRKWHDAWQVQRADVGRLIEQCFRQRLVVEVQAEGKNKASINFVYDYAGATIIEAVRRFQKNKREGDAL